MAQYGPRMARACPSPNHPQSGVYETLLIDDDAITRKPTAEMPVCHAPLRTAPITIDGRLDPAEWDGLDRAQAAALNRTPSHRPTLARPSYLWLRRDAGGLYIGLLNELNPGEIAKSCCFNVGVLKPSTQPNRETKEKPTAGEIWAVWCGTNGANWKVWNAGVLYLQER